MENKIHTTLSVTHLVIGIAFTLITSIGGAYITLREGDVERNARLDSHERRIEKIETRQDVTDARYLEILAKLHEIQLQLKDKKDKE